MEFFELIKTSNYYRNLNIYEVCIPDRMYHIDLSLFKYQFEFTQEILKNIGGTQLQRKFDDRLHNIPHFPELKLFNKLGKLKLMTTTDH